MREDGGSIHSAHGAGVLACSSAHDALDRPTAPPRRKITGLIVCASMPGSASTLQYDLVRSLTERFLEGTDGGCFETFDTFAARFPEYARRDCADRDPLVINTHAFDARFASLIDPPAHGYVFYMYRDIRDALVSRVSKSRSFPPEGADRLAGTWTEWAEQWCSLANAAISRYEFAVRHTREELRRYARVLDIHLAPQEIAEIAARGEQSAEEGWGKWQNEMAPEERRRVWHVAGDWMERHDYPRHEQTADERNPIRVSEQALVDLAPPGLPRTRGHADPIVESFRSWLQSPHPTTGAAEGNSAQPASLFWGETISVLPGEGVSEELLAHGVFEEGLTWALIQCLRPGDTFIDVGAHVGYFTALGAHLVGNSGRVEALEPCPATARVLQGNVEELSQVRVNKLAAFSRNGSLVFHDLGTEYAAYNSIYQPRLEGADQPPTCRELDVEATTLDDFCRERGLSPSFIKIDAESTELDVLRGSARLLREVQPIVSVEVGDLAVPGAPMSAEILEFAAEFGYQPYEYVSFAEFVPHRRRTRYAYDNLLLLPPQRNLRRDGRPATQSDHEQALRSALRSQARTIARHRSAHQSLRRSFAELPDLHRRNLEATASMHRAYVRSAWAALGRRFSNVALFGGGKYARWLIDEIETSQGGPRIVLVLDDGASEGDRIGSIPMVRPGSASLAGVDAVIVATDVPDSPLHKRCTPVCGSTPLVNLYAELPGGPFPKPSAKMRHRCPA